MAGIKKIFYDIIYQKYASQFDTRMVCGAGLFHSDIGLAVIGSGLWVYTKDVRLVGYEGLTGR